MLALWNANEFVPIGTGGTMLASDDVVTSGVDIVASWTVLHLIIFSGVRIANVFDAANVVREVISRAILRCLAVPIRLVHAIVVRLLTPVAIRN